MTEAVAYGFGPYRFDARDRLLTRDAAPIPLTPKAADLLLALLESDGRVVTKEELIQRVWPSTFVEGGSLTFQIYVLRQSLADSAEDPRYIETVQRRGYRFLVPIKRLPVEHQPFPGANSSAAPAEAFYAEPAGQTEPPSQIVEPTPFDASDAAGVRRWPGLLTFGALVILAVTSAIIVFGFRDPPFLSVVRVTQLTHDGKMKGSLLWLDQSRLLFTVLWAQRELRIDSGGIAARSEALDPYVFLDISRFRSEALAIRPRDPGAERGLWIVRLDGTKARRLGMAQTGGSAAWSHDARRIAYTDDHNVYIADADGPTNRLIATVTGYAGSVQWGPADRFVRIHVANASDRTRTQALYDIDADGSEPRPVLPVPPASRPCCGFWMPGAADYVFESVSGTTQQIWVRREPRHLLWSGQPQLRQLSPTTAGIQYSSPVANADGSRIYVVGTAEPRLSRYDTNRRDFVPYLGGISAFAVEFSPDRQSVTYITHSDSMLWRARADGSEPHQLTFAPWYVEASAWSPDGRRLAIRARRSPGKHAKVYLMSAEGGTPEPLDPRDVEQGSPTWSPDGTKLTFGDVPEFYGHPGGGEMIHIYDLTDRRISDVAGSGGLWSSRWSPDGRHLAATRIVDRMLMLFTFERNQWRELAVTMVGDLAWSRDGRYIYCEPEPFARWFRRVSVPDGHIEALIDLSEEVLPRFGAGLALDGTKLFLRSATDIFAFELAPTMK
jgi:DNA-binding winged helix-turn-helix (wHTH) protein/Tol biopolymer transport system component